MSSNATGVTVIYTPPPTPNGPLHVGHLSGPYIAGDVAARAARSAGVRVLSVCGLDSHQNYVLARAEADGTTAEVAIERYGSLVRQAMRGARIEYDVFFEPYGDADYQHGVTQLLDELVAAGAIGIEETTLTGCSSCGRTLHHVRVSGRCPVCGDAAGGGTCESCGSFVTAATLTAATSTCCSAEPVPMQRTIPVLRLESLREQLVEVWSNAAIPSRVQRLIAGYLRDGLPVVPVAYETDWGIPWRHPDIPDVELRIDVWVEMGLGYLFGTARALGGPRPEGVADCLARWSDVADIWHFFGVDNAFYYTVLVPAIFCAAGMRRDVLAGVVVNEFYRLDGLKFSTSRGHAIWAHEFLAEEDPAVVRAYVSWDRPDTYSTDFTVESFEAFKKHHAGTFAEPAAELPGAVSDVDPHLAGRDARRARHALQLASFDPALSVRCVLAASASGEPDLAAARAAITGAPS